ncbi:efflux RND transporter periplasmic adaptor subunit [Anaerovorax odorimutans]|uniref:efflux RND transporter periplasmic adaptor subunit n=1 Tax=Anaerovorax odorimutans TaxID=109327 RepID=UPI000405CC20|nr:efflux RND transporter periplasmic adaptor subunit [Anaerovorax odorimutans]
MLAWLNKKLNEVKGRLDKSVDNLDEKQELATIKTGKAGSKLKQRFGWLNCKKIIFVIVLILLILVALNVRSHMMKTTEYKQPILVKTMEISKTGDKSEYSYAGEVCAEYESNLAFQVGGKIIKRNVALGDTVHEGDVLFEIDSQDVEQGVSIKAAAVSAARSQYALAKDNLDRFTDLYQNGAATQLDYQNAQNSFQAASSALQQANAAYTQGRNQLDYCRLVSDKSGIISDINVEEGQVVSAGQVVVTIIQDDNLQVKVNIPENKIDSIKVSSNVDITFWALKGIEVKGNVSEISPVADAASRTYEVTLDLINPPKDIKPGMSAMVVILPDNPQKNIFVPLEAIYQVTSDSAVWIVENNMVRQQMVKVGEFSGNNVKIEKGLKDGDVIVTAGVHRLFDGQQVKAEGRIQ